MRLKSEFFGLSAAHGSHRNPKRVTLDGRSRRRSDAAGFGQSPASAADSCEAGTIAKDLPLWYLYRVNIMPQNYSDDDPRTWAVVSYNGVIYPDYRISRGGVVRRIKKDGSFSPPLSNKPDSKTGYVNIYVREHPNTKLKKLSVHRLVAVAYISCPPSNSHVVDHIDRIKTHNHVDNLRWATSVENADNVHKPTPDNMKEEIRSRILPDHELMAKYNISIHTLRNIRNKRKAR